MSEREKRLLMDCKNQFEWLQKVFPNSKTTSTNTLIDRIEEIFVKNVATTQSISSNGYWRSVINTKNYKCLVNKTNDCMIHIVKTGFIDLYTVWEENPYNLEKHSPCVMTLQDIMDKYLINF